MKIGVNMTIISKAARPPYKVYTIAKCPLPFNSNLWPGRIERKESSSGAPRKIEGIKSMKVWAIAIDVIKIARVKGLVICRKVVEKDNKMTEIKFIWIPGDRPVSVPARRPRISAIIKSNIEL